MQVGIIGLGKMGLNLSFNLKDKGYDVKGLDISSDSCKQAEEYGIETFDDVEKMVFSFSGRKIIWLMLPSGEITENMLNKLKNILNADDVVIEGGNSNFNDSVRRAKDFEKNGINYFDCGTSGGVSGARNGVCLMIGGDKGKFKEIECIFKDISVKNGYLYTGESGSGHFTKMVHNGIEYAMMQGIAEGFQIMEESDYNFDLEKVARVWNNGSVVRSWLMEIMEDKFKEQPHLENYRGIVDASGEAKWTIETALDMNIAVPTIAMSLFMRNMSKEEDSFSAKVVSAMRNGFGGHDIVEK